MWRISLCKYWMFWKHILPMSFRSSSSIVWRRGNNRHSFMIPQKKPVTLKNTITPFLSNVIFCQHWMNIASTISPAPLQRAINMRYAILCEKVIISLLIPFWKSNPHQKMLTKIRAWRNKFSMINMLYMLSARRSLYNTEQLLLILLYIYC